MQDDAEKAPVEAESIFMMGRSAGKTPESPRWEDAFDDGHEYTLTEIAERLEPYLARLVAALREAEGRCCCNRGFHMHVAQIMHGSMGGDLAKTLGQNGICPLCLEHNDDFAERLETAVDRINVVEARLREAEARAALADEAMHYCEFSRPFSNEDDSFWDSWQERYRAAAQGRRVMCGYVISGRWPCTERLGHPAAHCSAKALRPRK